MLPDPNMPQGAAGNGGGQTLRTVDALKPGFQLSFDNSPTELSTWLSLFRSFFEASRLHILPIDQQQAFLRQGLSPEVWTVIKNQLNLEMRVFKNPAHPHEDSCESIIEEAFQVRYPLIMRRFNFFKYERKGSQTYSDFHAKLQELATAANLENLDMNDYFLYKLIVGLNDPKTIDRILSIPSQDFNLEEVHRVAVQCETARNYSSLQNNSSNLTNQNNPNSNSSNKKPPSGQDKLKALKQQGKCVRCGKQAHKKGSECPHKNTTCHKCGTKGHISPVCAKGGSNSGKNNQKRPIRLTTLLQELHLAQGPLQDKKCLFKMIHNVFSMMLFLIQDHHVQYLVKNFWMPKASNFNLTWILRSCSMPQTLL